MNNISSAPIPTRRNNILLMAILIAAIAIYGYQVFLNTYYFDIWYIIATGREIVENGIPHENVFSMVDGLQIVLQQWLLCVICFAVYDLLGFGGISLLVTLVFFATIFVLYRIMRTKRHDSFGGEWILLLLMLVMVAIVAQFKMMSTPFSILVLSTLVLLLEKYRRDGRWIWLGLVVPLVIFHMQIHMSFILFDLAIIACYAIPDFISPIRNWLAKRAVRSGNSVATTASSIGSKVGAANIEGVGNNDVSASDNANVIVETEVCTNASGADSSAPHIGLADSDYKRLPLLVLLIVSALATLVNPYGIDGSLYLLNSYGAASYGNVIPELRPQTLFAYSIFGVCALITTLISAASIGKAGLRRMDLPAILIFACCTYLGFSNMRNLWMLGLPAVLLAATAMRGWYIPKISDVLTRFRGERTKVSRNPLSSGRYAYPEWVMMLTSAICTAGVGVFTILVALNFSYIDDNSMDDRYTPRALLNAITRDAGKSEDPSVEQDELKIFNPTVLGGYMEWEGFPVYNDSRVEVWNSAISGSDRDLHNEYVDMTLGKWDISQFDKFVDENDFDYLIAEMNSPLHAYLAQNPNYQNILGTQYYELYKKL